MIMSDAHRVALLHIANKLSKVQQGVPKNANGDPTGTYLMYLSLLYDEEAAEIIQHLEVFPKAVTANALAKKLNRDKKEITKILEGLAEKFFLMKAGGYAIPTPLMIYDAPFILKRNVDREDIKEFAELSHKFFEKEGYYKNWETSYKGTPRTRILTVSEEIEDRRSIIPIEEVYNIIEKTESFALIPCPCRRRADIEGVRKCKDKYPVFNCVLLGPNAEAILSLGDPENKRITKEEVIKIVKEASKLGLVHTTDNYTGPNNILCQCCECCCGLLAGLTRPGLNNPKAIAKANFIATVNAENCAACGTCTDRCKFGAITVEDIAKVNEERCMGCGLCAVTCPNDAIIMKRLEREQIPGA
jgi:ferredoxin